MSIYFMCWGPIRGACGHKHRTLAAAERCLERDRRGCATQGGYSDRTIRLWARSYDVRIGPPRLAASGRTR